MADSFFGFDTSLSPSEEEGLRLGEASLSQLVLDDTDTTHKNTLGSSVWRHDLFPAHQPVQPLKNVCTISTGYITTTTRLAGASFIAVRASAYRSQ
ncbi:unnamed protein product [Leptidea sinapis]|uniref:Uncharacterized protein n=1 Tax=Leptidea sinapis TaxID=189913 RepID=A0A5E4QE95_9NEOP|nr:unnamed protein product [Leptidea sinapis]